MMCMIEGSNFKCSRTNVVTAVRPTVQTRRPQPTVRECKRECVHGRQRVRALVRRWGPGRDVYIGVAASAPQLMTTGCVSTKFNTRTWGRGWLKELGDDGERWSDEQGKIMMQMGGMRYVFIEILASVDCNPYQNHI